MPLRRVHLIVDGRVQGVGFRFFTEAQAEKRNIGGWVMNRPDGKVEIEAVGKSEDIREFIEKVKKGPSMAVVTGITFLEDEEVNDDPYNGTFRIKYYGWY